MASSRPSDATMCTSTDDCFCHEQLRHSPGPNSARPRRRSSASSASSSSSERPSGFDSGMAIGGDEDIWLVARNHDTPPTASSELPYIRTCRGAADRQAHLNSGSQVPLQNCSMSPPSRRNALICSPAVKVPVEPCAPLLNTGAALPSGGIPEAHCVRDAGSPTPGHCASVVQKAPRSVVPGVWHRFPPRCGSISTNAEPSKGAGISGIWKKLRHAVHEEDPRSRRVGGHEERRLEGALDARPDVRRSGRCRRRRRRSSP